MAHDDTGSKPTPGSATGLLATLQRFLATFVEILHTRVELLTTELEEERARLRQLVIYGLVSVFFLGLGLITATAFIVMAVWEPYRLYVLGGFAVLYLGIGVVTARLVQRKIKTRPGLLSVTLSELRKDREQLTSRS